MTTITVHILYTEYHLMKDVSAFLLGRLSSALNNSEDGNEGFARINDLRFMSHD